MTKKEYRKVLQEFELFMAEVFLEKKNYSKEYYVWYNMIITFAKNRKNNIMYLKFEGEIPVVLIEYINIKYPKNDILSLYSQNDVNIKNCNVVLIKNIKDLKIFLTESKKFWNEMASLEEELLSLNNNYTKKLIS